MKQINEKSDKGIASDFYAILGDLYHSKEMHAEAYAAYDSSLVYNPNNIGTLNNYAYYLSVERTNLDKAEEMSYKTVKAEPENATYLDTYAWILFEKKRYTEARIYIEQAMKNGGDSSQVIQSVLRFEADLGIGSICTNHEKCMCMPLLKDHIVLATPNTEEYRSLNGVFPLDKLKKETFVIRESGSGTKIAYESIEKR